LGQVLSLILQRLLVFTDLLLQGLNGHLWRRVTAERRVLKDEERRVKIQAICKNI